MRRITSGSPLEYRTIPEALEAAPAAQPFLTMWKSEEETQTFTMGEFRVLVAAQAAFLRQRGVTLGDTVIFVMPQGVFLMAGFVAALYLGAVPSILAYPNSKIDPSKYRFGLSGVSANLKARIIVVDDTFAEELIAHLTVDETCKVTRMDTSPSLVYTSISPAHVDSDRTAFIQHSAGTTGLQKGVALSHSAVLRHVNRLASALRVTSEDCIYSWLPLYHDMGLITSFLLPLICHIPVIMQSPMDWVVQPRTMLEIITRYHCSLAWVPNFTLQFLVRSVRPEDRTLYDLSSIRMLINCSEPIRAASMDEFVGAYEPSHLRLHALQSSYAMAETVFAATQSGCNGLAGPARAWVDAAVLRKQHLAVEVEPGAPGAICLISSGTCLPGTEIRIVSEHGDPLPAGRVGEIAIHSDAMLDGYYNRADLTTKVLHDGFYFSGDLGFELDEEFYVIGRKKDLIIVGGENIYPQDIEEIIFRNPFIRDGRAVAIGVFNSRLGTQEIVGVAEVVDEGHLEHAIEIESDLKKSIKMELAISVRAIYLKAPKWIVKSTAGKPARSTTREKLFSEHSELSVDALGGSDA